MHTWFQKDGTRSVGHGLKSLSIILLAHSFIGSPGCNFDNFTMVVDCRARGYVERGVRFILVGGDHGMCSKLSIKLNVSFLVPNPFDFFLSKKQVTKSD